MSVLIMVLSALGLFVGMMALSEYGRRVGRATLARDPNGLSKGVGAAEGAVFALLGLMIAFTFSGAASRLQDRRELVTEEANMIGTAYLRIDVLPEDAQPEMRALMKRYVEHRLLTYSEVSDMALTQQRLADGEALQKQIWQKAVEAVMRPDGKSQQALLMLPALNQMIDITTTRLMATRIHPPLVVYLVLMALGLVAALLVGYATADNPRRTWLHNVLFAAVVSTVVYVIIDLEFPRLGLIRVDSADEVLVMARASMGD